MPLPPENKKLKNNNSPFRENNRYLQSILDNTHDIIIITDNDSKIVEFNRGAEITLEYEREEVIGQHISTIYKDAGERQKIKIAVEKAGYLYNYETTLLSKSGREVEIGLTLSQMKDGDGNITGTVGTSKDISLRKKIERDLKEKNEALTRLSKELENKVRERTRDIEAAKSEVERASLMKSEFLANMSHELRTPLNSILGFSEILLDGVFGEINEKQGKYISNISNSGKRLLEMINDILDISKIEAGRMELHPHPLQLDSTIFETIDTMRACAEEKGLDISAELDKNIVNIYADEARFRQVVYNLLNNAVKFTDSGRIVIASSLCKGEERGFVQISVSDSGIGIGEEDKPHIFDSFRQADSSITRRHGGTGLGLAICKKIIEMHGGNIWLESKAGKGSTFYFTIPADKRSR